MTQSQRLYVLSVLLIVSLCGLTMLLSCSSKSTDSDNPPSEAGTVTYELTAPHGENIDGHEVTACLYATVGDDSAVACGTGVFADGTATVTIDNVEGGTYVTLVAIDADSSGMSDAIEMEDGDPFWGELHVAVDGDQTITVGEYYWQVNAQDGLVVILDNVPTAQNGKIIGAGIFPDGYDVLANPTPEALTGGAGYVCNGSAILAIQGDRKKAVAPKVAFPSGDYDLWSVIDIDGTPEQWFGESGAGGLETGDLVDHFDLTVDEETGLVQRTGQFSAIQARTVTLTANIPAGWGLTGHTLFACLFTEFDSLPVVTTEQTIAGAATNLTLTTFHAGEFQVVAGVDADNSGAFEEDGNPSLTEGDLIWGALDVPLVTVQSATIIDSAWQSFGGLMYAVRNIPTGHNSQPCAVALYEPGAEPLNPNREPILAGAALIYFNSALVAVHLASPPSNAAAAIAPEELDRYCLIDVDGHMADYVEASAMEHITVGDLYIKETTPIDPENGDLQEVNGSFLPVVAVSGTITCPEYTSNPIYVYLFHQNPFTEDNVDIASRAVLTAPGDYEIPCLANDSVFIAGFWDQDNSGDEEGPTVGDYIGAYGVAVSGDLGAMTKVGTSTLSAGSKNFTIWMLNMPQLLRLSR